MTNEEAAMLSSKKKLEEFKKEWCKKIDGTYRCELGCPFVDCKKCIVNEFIVKAKNYKRNLCKKKGEEMMGDVMQFPDDWKKFLSDYSFRDDKEIYTNGSLLIPSFRVEQMMEHYLPGEEDKQSGEIWKKRFDKKFGWMVSCPHCGDEFFESDEVCIRFDYCPHCGHPMKHEYQAAIGGQNERD